MPNPQIISIGGMASGSASNLSFPPPPILQDNDILIAVIGGTSNGQVPAITGFTAVINTNSTNFAGHRWVAWKRASSESGNYDTTGLSAGTNWGVIVAVRYAKDSGSPINTSSSTDKTNTGTALTCTAITPSVDGCLLLSLFPQPNAAAVSGYTDGGPTLTWQEEFDVAQTATLSIGSAVQATAANIAPTATNTSAGFAHMIAVAIEPFTETLATYTGPPGIMAEVFKEVVH